MAGYWSVEGINDQDKLWWEGESGAGVFSLTRTTPTGELRHLDPVTTSLIWSLPTINIEEITAENAEEVFIRVRMLELSRGPLLRNGIYLTPPDICRRIGLISVPDMRVLPFEDSTLHALREKGRKAWKAAAST